MNDRYLEGASDNSANTLGDDMLHDDDDVWTTLRSSDYVHLCITSCYQGVVLLVVAHLWLCRKWPPYIPRQISLVCMTGLAGIVAYCGALIAYGVFERKEGDLLAYCSVEGLFDYVGWGVWTSVALVRVYRSWKLLVKHSIDMWPAWGQVALLSAPWFLPVVAYSINPDLAEFNERGNWCDINVPIDTALNVFGCVPILVAFGLSYQMRKVRKQMNFFKTQILQLAFLLITGSILFPLLEGWLETRDDIRRTWIMYDNVVSSLILFWPPIVVPLYRYILGDEAFLNSYTKGFSSLPTPAQMRSSLKDQLSLEELRREFERFADSKVARELPDFYKACLDREEIEDFFERQAATTAIIDRFVRVGSDQEVNLSGEIRQKILHMEITSYNIFNDAMADVLKMMDSNFSADFQQSEGYKKLDVVVQNEAAELERLRKTSQLPPKEHVAQDPKGLLKLLRRVSDTVGAGRSSSKEGRSSAQSERTHSSSGFPRQDDRSALEHDLDEFDDEDGSLRRLSGPRARRGLTLPKELSPVERESKVDLAEEAELGRDGNGAQNGQVNRGQPSGPWDTQHESRRSYPSDSIERQYWTRPEGPDDGPHRIPDTTSPRDEQQDDADPGPPRMLPHRRSHSHLESPSVDSSYALQSARLSSAHSSSVSSPTFARLPPTYPQEHKAGGGDGCKVSPGASGSGSGTSPYMNPALSGRFSEESRSVSWCSEYYDNSLNSSSLSDSGPTNGSWLDKDT